MNPHPHAENMRLYAEDAAETDTPWRLWEVKARNGQIWGQIYGHPAWDEDAEYRRKQKPLECWVYVSDEGLRVGAAYGTKEAAEFYLNQARGFGWRIARMREVTE